MIGSGSVNALLLTRPASVECGGALALAAVGTGGLALAVAERDDDHERQQRRAAAIEAVLRRWRGPAEARPNYHRSARAGRSVSRLPQPRLDGAGESAAGGSMLGTAPQPRT